MTYHSPPVMVAIGLLGDEAVGNQSATTHWSHTTDSESPAVTLDQLFGCRKSLME